MVCNGAAFWTMVEGDVIIYLNFTDEIVRSNIDIDQNNIGSLRMKILIFSALAVLFLGACEDAETNAIAKAQRCLDKVVGGTVASRAAAATNCKAMVGGYSSADSYSIRCAADFIGDGLDSTRISNAVGAMLDNSGGAGTDPAMMLMGMISFSSQTVADTAYANCVASGSAGYIYFASAARIGTTVAAAGGAQGAAVLAAIAAGNTPSAADIDAAIGNASGGASGAQQEAIGATASTLYTSQCAVVTSANESICNQISSAINSNPGNNQAIGAALLALLQN